LSTVKPKMGKAGFLFRSVGCVDVNKVLVYNVLNRNWSLRILPVVALIG